MRFWGRSDCFHVRRGVAQTGVIGYWIGQRYARGGLMSDAVETVTRFAFDDLGLHRLEAACMPEESRFGCPSD